MKRLILFIMLMSSLYAFDYDPKVYLGIGTGVQQENFIQNAKASNTPLFGTLKIGYGDIRAYSIELCINYINNRSNIFSPNDQARYGMDVMFVKAYNFTDAFYPFVRAGFGAGEMKVQRELQNKLAYSSYNLGGGLSIPINKHIAAEGSYEFRTTSYQSIDLIAKKLKVKSHIHQFYIGLTYRF